MANYSTINTDRLLLALEGAISGAIGAQAVLDAGIIERVMVPVITADTLTNLRVRAAGTPLILPARDSGVNTMTLTEATSTVAVGQIPLKIDLTYAQIDRIAASAEQVRARVGDSAGGVEQMIASTWVSAHVPKLLTEWSLTLMKNAVAANSNAMTVDITGADAPADQITASTARSVLGRLYSTFGEDVGVGQFAGFIGNSVTASNFNEINNPATNAAVYDRNELGQVIVSKLPILQCDIADSSPSGALLSNIYGTQSDSTIDDETVLRLYLAKKNSVRAYMTGTLDALARNLKITEVSGVGGSTGKPGLSFYLQLDVAMECLSEMPFGTKPGVAALLHHRVAVG